MEDALCPNCKKELKVKTCISETQAIMRCKQCKKNFNITFDEKNFLENSTHSIGVHFYWDGYGVLVMEKLD